MGLDPKSWKKRKPCKQENNKSGTNKARPGRRVTGFVQRVFKQNYAFFPSPGPLQPIPSSIAKGDLHIFAKLF